MGKLLKNIVKWLFRIIIGFIVFSVVLTAAYTYIDPPFTPLMFIRVVEGWFDAKSTGITKEWRDYEEISPNVFKAVMSGEDARFMSHEGFDWKAIERAQKLNKTRKRPLGASTISMQTSKNTFLWHGRNYVRKGLEAYYTVLIEALWGKKRILEVYVNVIEWGDGIYGVEAAAQTYFHKSAAQLSQREAALLAAVIPNPRRWNPAKPTSYILKRASFIQGRMNSLRPPKE